MPAGVTRLGFLPAEVAHLYRDLLELGNTERVHGHRNVSRETHLKLLRKMELYLEATYGVPYTVPHPRSSAAKADLGEE